ncbi:hypothetical protein ACJBU6_09943 [Exserohilum turcicum]
MPATSAMMTAAPYEIWTGGDGKTKKQSMAELKLRRLTELNQRLREDLERRRIPVSEAALDLIAFTDKEPKDWMVPSRWGTVRLHPGARALSTSATIPTRHNRATAAVSSCRQRARCRWSCPLTAFLRGVGLRQSDLFLLVLEEVDNTQRTQSLDTVSRRGKRNYRTGLMFLSPNVYIKTRMRSSLLGLLRVSFFSLFLFFFLMVGGFLLGVHDEIKALA